MSIKFGSISRILPDITQDIFNNIGKHNNFAIITNSNNRYPGKTDPIIVRFNGDINEWIYVTDKNTSNFGYLTEDLLLDNNELVLHKVPLDMIIWDVFTLDGSGNIISKIDKSDYSLNINTLTLSDKYVGSRITLMYCFGDRSNNGKILPVDIPVKKTYKDEELNKSKYAGPSDINDIVVTRTYPGSMSDLDKDMLKRIEKLEAINATNALYTDERLLITDNKATLSYMNKGSIVYNKAILFSSDDPSDNLIVMEVTCNVVDGILIFDEDDQVNGLYATVTYMVDLRNELDELFI